MKYINFFNNKAIKLLNLYQFHQKIFFLIDMHKTETNTQISVIFVISKPTTAQQQHGKIQNKNNYNNHNDVA